MQEHGQEQETGLGTAIRAIAAGVARDIVQMGPLAALRHARKVLAEQWAASSAPTEEHDAAPAGPQPTEGQALVSPPPLRIEVIAERGEVHVHDEVLEDGTTTLRNGLRIYAEPLCTVWEMWGPVDGSACVDVTAAATAPVTSARSETPPVVEARQVTLSEGWVCVVHPAPAEQLSLMRHSPRAVTVSTLTEAP